MTIAAESRRWRFSDPCTTFVVPGPDHSRGGAGPTARIVLQQRSGHVKRRPIVLVVAIALLAIAPAIARGNSARSESNTQTYQDSTGEDAAAPDITTVTVSNDDAGTISFQINIANRPALTPDMLIDILVDSDNNPATGEPNSGADYAIELVAGAVDLFRWNGSDFVSGAPQSSLIFSYTPAGPVIRVSALELGKTKAFAFSIDAASGIAVDASWQPGLHERPRRPRSGSRTRNVCLPGDDEAEPEGGRLHDVPDSGEGRQAVLSRPGRDRE